MGILSEHGKQVKHTQNNHIQPTPTTGEIMSSYLHKLSCDSHYNDKECNCNPETFTNPHQPVSEPGIPDWQLRKEARERGEFPGTFRFPGHTPEPTEEQ